MLAAAPAQASQWPLAGGDASHSGFQGVPAGAVPAAPAWSKAGPDAGIRTPVIVTGGGGPGVQRVAYGTTQGAVHLRVLDSGSGVGPEEGTPIATGAVTNPSLAFGAGSNSVGFADTSSADRLGVIYVVHNDGPGVEIARIDAQTGGHLDASDPSVASSGGCTINGSPVLTPPNGSGGRVLFFVLKAAGGACPADNTLVRVPIEGDAVSPGAHLGATTFAKLDSTTRGAGPSLVVLNDKSGAARFYVAVGGLGSMWFFEANRAFDDRPPVAATQADFAVALGANEAAQTLSAPVAASALVAGSESSGVPAAVAMYVATNAGGDAKVYRLVQHAQAVVRDKAVALPGSGAPAPALTVAQSMLPAGPTADGRLVVTSAANLTVLRTDDLGLVSRLAAAPLPPGQGFSRTTAAASGAYAFVERDGADDAVPALLALRLSDGAAVAPSELPAPKGLAPGQAAGQPAIARGLVVFGTPSGAFAFRLRDITAPHVELAAPAPGRLGKGTPLLALAGDDRGIASVQFRLLGGGEPYVIGKATSELSGSPYDGDARYVAEADIGEVPDGRYQLDATAVDPSGNAASSARRQVTIGTTGACTHLLRGTAGPDRLRGSSGGDRLLGGGGPDRLYGRGGADCLYGGAGADLLDGGSGRNRFYGGGGADRIVARNRFLDVIRCGGGRDRVVADKGDRVSRDCERVKRR